MHLLLEVQLTGVVTGQVCPTVVKSAIKCPELVFSCPNLRITGCKFCLFGTLFALKSTCFHVTRRNNVIKNLFLLPPQNIQVSQLFQGCYIMHYYISG